MALRDLLGVGILGALGFMALKSWNGPILQAPLKLGEDVAATYLNRLAIAESGGRPNVKAKTSSASGLYQFIKSTWEAMGGKWGDDPSKPFGGLTPSIAEQTAAAARFTNANAMALLASGIVVTPAALYAAHFLGTSRAIAILKAPPTERVASILPANVISANPFLRNLTVAGFIETMQRKIGV